MKKQFLSVILIVCLFLTTAAIPASAASGPVSSSNIGKQNYKYWSRPVTSYLYENEAGGLTRVEYINNQVVIENYDSSLTFQSGKTISDHLLPLWGGCFIGEQYNFLISGQGNSAETGDVEVIRVLKYSKDWQYLGQAGVYGANTSMPFDAGSLRCDEYDGYLYIRTCHRMYKSKGDGLNHQANLTVVVKQSDMTIADSQYNVSNNTFGYVSHSFNQHIIIDEEGYLIALDHGDAYPRAIALFRYPSNTSGGKLHGPCQSSILQEFPGEIGDNYTGGSSGGLSETRSGYASVYCYNDDVYFAYTDKDTLKSTITRVTKTADASTPCLVSSGLSGGYILWNSTDGYQLSSTLHYAPYSSDGIIGAVSSSTAPLSDCQPIDYNGKVVWYTTKNSAPVFYTLNGQLLAESAAASATGFTDVSERAWYREAVQYMCERKLMSGVSATSFAPDAAATRGMVVTILHQLENTPVATPSSFSDVAAGKWYANAVAWAAENNIVSGYADGTFGPNDIVTREQMATILYNYAKYKGCDVTRSADVTHFADAAQIHNYAKTAMQWANAEGLINGVNKDILLPTGSTTRAQIASILMNFCEHAAK